MTQNFKSNDDLAKERRYKIEKQGANHRAFTRIYNYPKNNPYRPESIEHTWFEIGYTAEELISG
jgi:hypothetical protein